MSDRGRGSLADDGEFNPARGWDLYAVSVPDEADGPADSCRTDEPDSAHALDALIRAPDELLEDLDFSGQRGSSPPILPAAGPSGPDPPAPPDAPPRGKGRYPRPGDVLAGFRIVRELGRGAFARVYLAEQLALACRQVALKVSLHPVGEESERLARLQHSHIVPIHSVHEDEASGLHLICMPYLGGANLAQVLEVAAAEIWPAAEIPGVSLIEALDQVGGPLPSLPASRMILPSRHRSEEAPRRRSSEGSGRRRSGSGEGRSGAAVSPPRVRSVLVRYWSRIASWGGEGEESPDDQDENDRSQPARHFLRRASSIQASVWITARLAEGLDHAHSRGLLHRDLKPSNVLITADGMPMILDFNLSAIAEEHNNGDRARIGGTLPYMAPEHLDAFHPKGKTPASAVDERSDLYSLGLILFEMVTGVHPFRDPPEGPPIEGVLDDMILERLDGPPSARALNPEVSWGLDSILRKCLEPAPMRRYQSADDLAEDLRRFLEDRPLKHSAEPSLRERTEKFFRRNPRLRSTASIGTLSFVLLLTLISMLVAVNRRWEADAARLALNDFDRDFTRCQVLLNASGELDRRDRDEMRRGLDWARRALKRYEVERLGPDWIEGPMVRTLSREDRETLIEQVSELLMLEARATVLASRGGTEADYAAALGRAIRRLELAERIDPNPPSTLFAERASYEAALGLAEESDRDRRKAEAIPPTTARDHYLRGTVALANGRLDLAEAYLDLAIGLDPRRFWSWFSLGLCHFEQRRYGAAASDFAACSLIEPGSARAMANRGLALAMDGRIPEARRAYDKALELDPELVSVRINRALASLELDDPVRASEDLKIAIDRTGRRDPVLLAAWGEALARSGRRSEADRHFGDALKDRPGDPFILVARGFVRLATAPNAAREDFERALASSPRSARAHLGMAHVLREDEPERALDHLDRALAAEPGLIDAVQLRALVRARLGLRSAVADVDFLRQSPTAHRLYNGASALAILSEATDDPTLKEESLSLLRRALDSGIDPRFAADDPDLASLRDLPGFRKLVPTTSTSASE